ncbi:MAG: hypothetical protein ACREOH_10210 [Candidatus Entotheonellia bacterium]
MSFITLGVLLGEGWVQTSATVHRLLVVSSGIAVIVVIASVMLVRKVRR